MALQDYPHIATLFATLTEEKEAIVADVAPLRNEYEALHLKLSPDMARLRELGKAIRAAEQPRLSEICGELAVLARASGGRAISDPLREAAR